MNLKFTDFSQNNLRITDDLSLTDSPYIFAEPIASLIRKANLAVIENTNKHIEKKLKQWIEEYPQVPMFKNILSAYYSKKGKKEKAFECNHLIVQQHPDYIFGKLNLLEEYLFSNQLNKADELLGHSHNIVAFTNNRHIFHFLEYSNFHKLLIRYWLQTNQLDNVINVFNNLLKLEEILEEDLELYLLDEQLCNAGLKEPDEDDDDDYCRITPTLPQTTHPPIFHFPQIQWLYENSCKIEKEKLQEILHLQREPLITDLCEVLNDAIRRYDYFSEIEFEFQTHSFAIHSLYLLMQLKATEALPTILEFCRQPEDVLDFWIGDLLTENIWQVIYATGQSQLPILEAFLKEPLNYTFSRTNMSTVISQVALHQPHRRQEVLEIYKRLLHFYFEKKENSSIVPLEFITLFVSDIADFNGTELEANIKQFFDADLIDLSFQRSWESFHRDLTTLYDDPSYSIKRPLQSCFEIFDEIKADEYREELISPPKPYTRNTL